MRISETVKKAKLYKDEKAAARYRARAEGALLQLTAKALRLVAGAFLRREKAIERAELLRAQGIVEENRFNWPHWVSIPTEWSPQMLESTRTFPKGWLKEAGVRPASDDDFKRVFAANHKLPEEAPLDEEQVQQLYRGAYDIVSLTMHYKAEDYYTTSASSAVATVITRRSCVAESIAETVFETRCACVQDFCKTIAEPVYVKGLMKDTPASLEEASAWVTKKEMTAGEGYWKPVGEESKEVMLVMPIDFPDCFRLVDVEIKNNIATQYSHASSYKRRPKRGDALVEFMINYSGPPVYIVSSNTQEEDNVLGKPKEVTGWVSGHVDDGSPKWALLRAHCCCCRSC